MEEKRAAVFCDNVRVKQYNDHVVMTFVQFVEGLAEDKPESMVFSNVAVSIPHFLKLARVVGDVAEKIKKENEVEK